MGKKKVKSQKILWQLTGIRLNKMIALNILYAPHYKKVYALHIDQNITASVKIK